MNDKYVKPKFEIIHHAGQVDEATTLDGIHVKRETKVWIQDKDGQNGRFVGCTPYDSHFVFIDPNWMKVKGRWFSYCTCGSPAVLVGSNTYKQDASPNTDSTRIGEMLICWFHASYGKHADGSS